MFKRLIERLKTIGTVAKLFLLFFFLSTVVVGVGGSYLLWGTHFKAAEPVYLYVDATKNFSDLSRQIRDSGCCKHPAFFEWLCRLTGYTEAMFTGRYEIAGEMSHFEVLNRLRRGHQKALLLTFNNVRRKEDLADRFDKQLMFSADDFLPLLNDSAFCDSLGFTTETILAVFIPNTYEVYWNLSPRGLVLRMVKEYNRFWNAERKRKAEALGLSPVEVEVLASIVQEESAVIDEYPIIAGLYLNRLRIGMLLQADPTVKFAVGDFSLKRILTRHTQIDSPYNTYKYPGLPPGLLRPALPTAIDAVLNPTKHAYLYMCAKEDFSGRHNFARSLNEHLNNASRYQRALNRRNIR